MSEPTIAPAPAAAAPTAPAPTAPPQAPAATATAPVQAPTTAPSATDPAAVIARLTAERDEWKGHSRTWEERAKAKTDQEALLAKVAQTLGIEGAKPTAEQIAQQAAAAQATAKQLARENAVLLAAPTIGADAAALLDSHSFRTQLEQIDPNDRAAVAAAVQAAVAANPRYAAQAAAPAAQPTAPVQMATSAGQFGQPAGDAQWTADDVAKASPAALSEAMAKGHLRNFLNS